MSSFRDSPVTTPKVQLKYMQKLAVKNQDSMDALVKELAAAQDLLEEKGKFYLKVPTIAPFSRPFTPNLSCRLYSFVYMRNGGVGVQFDQTT